MHPIMQSTFSLLISLLLATSVLHADEIPAPAAVLLERNCVGCHDGSSKKGNLDLTRWILILRIAHRITGFKFTIAL